MNKPIDFSTFLPRLYDYKCALEKKWPFTDDTHFESWRIGSVKLDKLEGSPVVGRLASMTADQLRASVYKEISWAMFWVTIYHSSSSSNDFQALEAYRMHMILYQEQSRRQSLDEVRQMFPGVPLEDIAMQDAIAYQAKYGETGSLQGRAGFILAHMKDPDVGRYLVTSPGLDDMPLDWLRAIALIVVESFENMV